jgi:transposase
MRMFIRKKYSKDKKTCVIQIVENHRMGLSTKQHVLRHMGTARTPEKRAQLQRLADVIKTQLENELILKQSKQVKPRFARQLDHLSISSKATLVDMSHVKEIKRQVLGIHDIYGFLYDQLGFTNVFTRPQQREEAAKILREIVLARIACPVSKRASVALLEEKFGVSLKLDHVYQMMDKIDEGFCERIQQRALSSTLKLTGEKLRVLFYDATTLYFESFIEDELKQNGYSKDMKFNQPQVLLALFVTEKGLPIGYELFPGSTFEGHTLIPVLEKLKARYQLEEVVFVADRGLLSEENLSLLEEKKFNYIVGARIKNVPKKLQDMILNEENYKSLDIKWNTHKKQKENPLQRMAVFEEKQERRLIVHYHSERAKKDMHDRSKSIEKLYKKLSKSKNPKALLNNYGYKKYIEVKGEAKLGINEAKIKESARWDGLLGVITNMTDSAPEKLLMYYRGLWQIEESFRINKHDLKMRPIYHWSPHRVKAHIAISFIAFVCVRYLEYILSIRAEKISPEIIRKSLLHVQGSILKDGASGKQFLVTSPLSAEANRIYKVMGIKTPAHTSQICGA